MEQPTPIDALANLQARLKELQAQHASLLAQAQQQGVRAAEWQNKYDSTTPRRRDPNDLLMVQDAMSFVQLYNTQAAAVQKDIDATRASIAQAEKDVQAYNAALANAASKGLVGEAATESARNEVERTKSRRVYIIVGGVVLILLVAVWAFLKIKKRKP